MLVFRVLSFQVSIVFVSSCVGDNNMDPAGVFMRRGGQTVLVCFVLRFSWSTLGKIFVVISAFFYSSDTGYGMPCIGTAVPGTYFAILYKSAHNRIQFVRNFIVFRNHEVSCFAFSVHSLQIYSLPAVCIAPSQKAGARLPNLGHQGSHDLG